MTEKLTVFFKKYYPYVVIPLMLTLFQALSTQPEPNAGTVPVFHTLIIESYPEETESDTDPESSEKTDPETVPVLEKSETDHTSVTEAPALASESETEIFTDPTEPPSIPDQILIEVPYYSQENWLPTGCETVSAKMLIEYYLKEEIPVENIIDLIHCEYPQDIHGKTYAPHPAKSFIGSPWDDSSFGCYAPVMVNALNALLPDSYTAIETTGTELQELVSTYLANGTPVLIWETMYMRQTVPTVGWYLLDDDGNPTDEWYQWQANEHCMVLVGYDADYYYFNDPLDNHGTIKYDKSVCEKRYAEQGKYSAVIIETEEDTSEPRKK